MHTLLIRTSALALLLMGVLVAGCDSASDDPDPMDVLLSDVRAATQQFTSTSAATSAGYAEDVHCVAHPTMGAMGVHWVNEPLIDPEFNPLQPEALLYEPQADGSSRLVGVEYIVIDAGQERPTFAGHPMDVGGVPPLEAAEVPHWSLHVWVHEDNPSGPFAPFNPNVTCEHATEAAHH